MENWTQKWIRPNMVLNISHFCLELGHLLERKEEEKKRRKMKKGMREEEAFKV